MIGGHCYGVGEVVHITQDRQLFNGHCQLTQSAQLDRCRPFGTHRHPVERSFPTTIEADRPVAAIRTSAKHSIGIRPTEATQPVRKQVDSYLGGVHTDQKRRTRYARKSIREPKSKAPLCLGCDLEPAGKPTAGLTVEHHPASAAFGGGDSLEGVCERRFGRAAACSGVQGGQSRVFEYPGTGALAMTSRQGSIP